MKIIKGDTPTVNFKSLAPGQVFVEQTGVCTYIKMSSSEKADGNAVSLEGGVLADFDDMDQVIHFPLATLTLKQTK